MHSHNQEASSRVNPHQDFDDLLSVWDSVRDSLRSLVSDTAFHIWIDPIRPAASSDDTVFITAPATICSWVEQRFGFIISKEICSSLGKDVRVKIVEESQFKSNTSTGIATDSHPTNRDGPLRKLKLNPKYSFDQFVIGGSNRFAHASSLAVAESPAQAYNPLFVYSSNGLGKTHLLQSIAEFLLRHSPNLNVIYTTVESFTNHFVSSIRNGDTFSFKEKFRKADVLLVDDVQFLEGKEKTQEEFFHTFNALYELGAQLVLSSDRSPDRLRPLHERLQSRFDLGLTVEISPPDFNTRLSILTKRASFDQIPDIDSAVLELIAQRITGNIRSLEGALIRIVAYSSLKQQRPSVELAKEVLDSLYVDPETQPSVTDTVKEVVSSKFNVSVGDLTSSSRAPNISLPRHVAMYISRQITDLSLPQIAQEFNRKDHTTVLSATSKISKLIDDDVALAKSVSESITEVNVRCPQTTHCLS